MHATEGSPQIDSCAATDRVQEPFASVLRRGTVGAFR